MVREGWLQGKAGPTVQEAFAYADARIKARYPSRRPMQIDRTSGRLRLGTLTATTAASNGQPRPASSRRRRPPRRLRASRASSSCCAARTESAATQRVWHRSSVPASGTDDEQQRREWDSNPRWVAPHTLSKRADSAALAPLLGYPPKVAPRTDEAIVSADPLSHVAVGSCATAVREPSQGREAAALSGACGVPQIA